MSECRLSLLLAVIAGLLISCSKKNRNSTPRNIKSDKHLMAMQYIEASKKIQNFRRGELRLKAVRLLFDTGDKKKALLQLAKIVEDEKAEVRTRARAKLLLIKQLGISEKSLLELMERFHSTVAAQDAFQLLISLWRKKLSDRQFLRNLEYMYPFYRKTNLGDNVLFTSASQMKHMNLENVVWNGKKFVNTKELAVHLFCKVYRDYPASSLADDSYYEASKLYINMKQYSKALRVLKKFLSLRGSSFIFGDYNSEHHDDAYVLLADIYCKMGKFKKCHKLMEKFSNEFPFSRNRDDVLYKLILSLKESGEHKKMCKSISIFLNKHKRSRFYNEVKTLMNTCSKRDIP
ncbi:MAG: tetratricopeptide repeat protein [Deltaproteobacteria bacterium]|nr:tetratricopeptide repeat protein [Deltaproteobacteria bacterium]